MSGKTRCFERPRRIDYFELETDALGRQEVNFVLSGFRRKGVAGVQLPGGHEVQGTLDGGVESGKINGDLPRRRRCHPFPPTLKNEGVGSKQD